MKCENCGGVAYRVCEKSTPGAIEGQQHYKGLWLVCRLCSALEVLKKIEYAVKYMDGGEFEEEVRKAMTLWSSG